MLPVVFPRQPRVQLESVGVEETLGIDWVSGEHSAELRQVQLRGDVHCEPQERTEEHFWLPADCQETPQTSDAINCRPGRVAVLGSHWWLDPVGTHHPWPEWTSDPRHQFIIIMHHLPGWSLACLSWKVRAVGNSGRQNHQNS